MESLKIKYEFCNYDEAHIALEEWKKSKPPNVAPYPTFIIDRVEVDPDNENSIVLWLELIGD